MKILYIFPHPDDESFGPAPAISNQVRSGNDVYLLSLTKGGATKMRHKLGLTIEQMGEVRLAEMQCVAEVLGLTNLTVLDLPDSGLKHLDPRDIEAVIENHIKAMKPDIVVTYPVHGISGFHDHIVCHQVVKRVFLELKGAGESYLKRLAFYTLTKAPDREGWHTLNVSAKNEIGCVIQAEDQDMEQFQRALDCYESYQEVVDQSGIRELVSNQIEFEIFGEKLEKPLKSLEEGL